MIRYDCNRLTAGIPRVVPFDNFREPIKVGIFPELTTANYSSTLAPRQDNVLWRDVSRPDFNIKINDIERWYNRIVEAIDNGFGIDVRI